MVTVDRDDGVARGVPYTEIFVVIAVSQLYGGWRRVAPRRSP